MITFKRTMSPSRGLFLWLLVLSITACGGGSSGSSNESSTVSDNVTATSPVAETSLRINPDNTLRSIEDLTIQAQVDAARSYLSICPDPGGELDVSTLNYDLCMVRTALDSNLKVIDLALPNHVDRLVAIVWFYEDGKAPLISTWQRNTEHFSVSGSIWRINQDG
jgi:hypothetical protein